MWTWIKAAYKWVSNMLYRPVRLIPSMWAQHAVTWVAHGAVTAFVTFAAYHQLGIPLLVRGVDATVPLFAWLGFVVAGVFYAARETLGWPITRPQVDHFGDVAGPIVMGSGLLFWLLR